MATDDQVKALLPGLINGKTHEELLENIVTNMEKTGDHYIDGARYPHLVQPSNLEAMKTFQVRDDDVYICAYPRSGTHWLAEIMHYILNDGRDDFDRTFMTHGLEITMCHDPSQVESTTPGYKVYQAMASPRCILCWSQARYLPPQSFSTKAKVVYVARNPKDMLVSVFKLLNAAEIGMAPANFDEHLWEFYSGQNNFGPWFDHVTSYWKHRDNENFMFLKYEDMHKDLRGTIVNIAKHVGKELSDDVIDHIVERVTFTGMQKTYKKLDDELGDEGREMTHAMGVTPYLRKGKVGKWKDEFTVAQNELFDKIYALKMQGTGLEFDFEI